MNVECKRKESNSDSEKDLRQEISSFVDIHREKFLAPRQIQKILRSFSEWRQRYASSSVLDDTFQRRVVYYLVERCFWSKIGDSVLVAELIRIVFEVDGHLHKFFYPRGGTMWKWRGIKSLSSMQLLSYFMEHAYKQRLLFCGKRFADSGSPAWLPPCSVALQLNSPDTMLLLLRYGALMSSKGNSKQKDLIELLRWSIGTAMALQSYVVGISFSEEVPKDVSPVLDAICCGRMLLRVASPFNIKCLFPSWSFKSSNTKSEAYQKISRQIDSVKISFPKLRRRCLEPSELKHLCRCKIRRLLYNKWELPHGIRILGLPAALHDYLDLRRD